MKNRYFSQDIIIPSINLVCKKWLSNFSHSAVVFLEMETPDNYDYLKLPPKLLFEGKTYNRILGKFYIPIDLQKEDYARFWDFVSDIYNSITDPVLHTSIYRIAIEKLCLPKDKKSRIMDFGIGTGNYVTNVWDENIIDLIGVDISLMMLKKAATNGINCIQVDGNSLPFGSLTFDGIISCYSIHLISSINIFRELYRVLKYEGFISFNIRLPLKGMFEDINFLSEVGFRGVVKQTINIPAKSKTMKTMFIWAKK